MMNEDEDDQALMDDHEAQEVSGIALRSVHSGDWHEVCLHEHFVRLRFRLNLNRA